MIADYVKSLGAVVFLCAVIEMLLPEGAFAKYARLAMGLIVMSVMAAPLAGNYSPEKLLPALEPNTFDSAAAQAEIDAQVLALHKANLEKIASEAVGGESVFIDIAPSGEVTRVTARIKNASGREREAIKNALGISADKIEVIYEDN